MLQLTYYNAPRETQDLGGAISVSSGTGLRYAFGSLNRNRDFSGGVCYRTVDETPGARRDAMGKADKLKKRNIVWFLRFSLFGLTVQLSSSPCIIALSTRRLVRKCCCQEVYWSRTVCRFA